MKSKLIVLLCGILFPLLTACHQMDPATEVIGRVAPWSRGKVVVKQMKAADGIQDAYELTTRNGKLIIRATSVPAAGMGFNYYLKNYCHQNFSMTGSNIQDIEVLPEIEGKITNSTTAQYRHFYNFCTLNYSASFWEWKDWQKAIDYMVLNGINLTLAPVGTEKVWYNTLSRMGYSEEEILAFLPGPCYNAWHMMGNLEGWGGPITRNMIEKRAGLAKKIIEAERKYGIQPIYMAFYGMVPTTLKDKQPAAKIIPQGHWAGGFQRPDMLSPLDPLYNQMAGIYYEEVNQLYGSFNFFAGEPFHEGGDRQGLDETQIAQAVYAKMKEYHPGAQWFLQAWGGNPSDQFLAGLAKSGEAIVWDFCSENDAVWDRRNGYDGFPFLWGCVNNFGETTGLYGKLQRFVDEYYRAKEAYPQTMVGVACSAEGILNNPVNYELLFELPWHAQAFSVEEWIKGYVAARYGTANGFNQNMYQVWQVLLETAYSSQTSDIHRPADADAARQELPPITGTPESLLCASPSLDLHSTSSWGTNFVFYDMEKMKTIIPSLLAELENMEDNDALEYDIVNFTRQLLANEFYQEYQRHSEAVKKGRLGPADAAAAHLLEILDDMDRLLSSRRDFMVGTWINAAKNYGQTDEEKRLCEWNARSIISYWGPATDDTSLRDYAHKEWSGIMRDLYKPRWKAYLEAARDHITNGRRIRVNATQMSIDWAQQTNRYPSTPTHDSAKMVYLVLTKIANDKY